MRWRIGTERTVYGSISEAFPSHRRYSAALMTVLGHFAHRDYRKAWL